MLNRTDKVGDVMSFGKTMLLNQDGDIELNAVHTVKMVEDEDKVKQDIVIILKTQKGADKFDPDFGFDAMSVVDHPTFQVVERALTEALRRYRFYDAIDQILVDFKRETRELILNVTVTVSDKPNTFTIGITTA